MATVTSIEDHRLSPTTARFQGGDETPISMFIVRYGRGQGPTLHLHPYPETFVVQEGTAHFTVGDEQIAVAAGHIVVVPRQTPHGFENRDDAPLAVLSVHPSPEVVQTDLE